MQDFAICTYDSGIYGIRHHHRDSSRQIPMHRDEDSCSDDKDLRTGHSAHLLDGGLGGVNSIDASYSGINLVLYSDSYLN